MENKLCRANLICLGSDWSGGVSRCLNSVFLEIGKAFDTISHNTLVDGVARCIPMERCSSVLIRIFINDLDEEVERERGLIRIQNGLDRSWWARIYRGGERRQMSRQMRDRSEVQIQEGRWKPSLAATPAKGIWVS